MSSFKLSRSSQILITICSFIFLWLEQPNLPWGLNALGISYQLILAGCTLCILVWLIRPNKQLKKPTSVDLKTEKKLFSQILKRHFKHIHKYSAQLLFSPKLQTILVLGLDGIGKSSILADSSECISNEMEQFNLSWWQQANQLICLGAPRLHSEKTAPYCASFWQKLCKKMRWHRLGRGFDELILVFHLPALHTPHEAHQARDVDQINAALAVILKQNKDIPIRIVFTHADCITGFNETFLQLDNIQRQSTWYMDCRQNTAMGVAAYSEAFDTWLTSLNQKLIQRLHQEPCLKNRALIKDFPLQILRLKKPIQQLLNQLCLPNPEQLQAIHLCSTKQTSKPFDYLTNSFTHDTNDSKKPFYQHEVSLFTKTLFKPLPAKSSNTLPVQIWYKMRSTWFVVSAIIGLFFAAHHQYQTMQSLAKGEVPDAHVWPVPSVIKTSPIWHAAIKARGQLDTLAQHDDYFQIFFPQIKQHKRRVAQYYHQLLAQQLIPMINQSLCKQLSLDQPLMKQSQAVFLSEQLRQHHEVSEPILSWLRRQFSLTNTSQPQLHRLLVDIIDHYQPSPKIQSRLKKIKQRMAALPADQHALLLAIAPYQSALDLKFFTVKLDGMYSPDTIKALSIATLQQKCQRIRANLTNTCAAKAKQRFYRLYTHYWLSQIKHPERLFQSSSKQSFQTKYNNISKAQAYIKIVLMTIKHQADLPERLQKAIAAADSQWQNMIDNQTHNTLFNIALSDHTSPQQSEEILQRLISWQNKAPTKHHPLTDAWQHYLYEQAIQSLNLTAKKAINSLWQKQIWSTYNTMIKSYYPFNKGAKKELSLQTFRMFFAPTGLLEKFMHQYIKPFASFDGKQWQPKPEAIVRLDPKALQQLAVAKWIQRMFFHDGDKPFVAFNLVPKHMNADIKSVILGLGQKRFFMVNGREPAISTTWPLHGEQTVSLNVVNQAGKSEFVSYHGAWAWFKLLKHATVNASLNMPQQFDLLFNLNGYQVSYLLITDAVMNPFVFDVFNVFKLPQNFC